MVKLKAKTVLRSELLNDCAIAVVENFGGVAEDVMNIERRGVRDTALYRFFAGLA